MSKKVVLAVGGTGGHVFPAIALADLLKKEIPEIEILFMGGKLEKNPYFTQSSYPYKSTHCGTLTKNPFKFFREGTNLLRGLWQSNKALREFKPDLMIGFGSYYSFPSLVAASYRKVPFILHESNSIPGKVNRFFSPRANVTGILFPQAAKKLKGKTEVVDMPLRTGYKSGSCNKKEALEYFKLPKWGPTLLIFGGSQGAQQLNLMAAEGITGDLQIIHITGSSLHLEKIQDYYRQKKIDACVKEFETRMDLAWQAADVALCRAGAGTISEALEFEVPCLLIPYPHASDDHQRGNAEFFCDFAKGGVWLHEKKLNPSVLNQAVQTLVGGQFFELKQSLKQYKEQQIRKAFSHLIAEHLDR